MMRFLRLFSLSAQVSDLAAENRKAEKAQWRRRDTPIVYLAGIVIAANSKQQSMQTLRERSDLRQGFFPLLTAKN